MIEVLANSISGESWLVDNLLLLPASSQGLSSVCVERRGLFGVSSSSYKDSKIKIPPL